MGEATGAEARRDAGAAVPEEAASQTPRLGVLFVHGIGEQPEGETLIAFGDPLLRWFRRWLGRPVKGAATGSLEVREAQLQRDSAGVASPPHALLDLKAQVGERKVKQQWVFAEHWWAAAVRPPKFSRLAGWLVTVGVWVIVSHATQGTGREGPEWKRWLAYWTRLTLGLLLAIGLQLLVGVLWLVSLLPLPWIGEALSRWLLRLTSVLGDSYVLSESEMNRAAIVSSTRAAIRWLAETCEHVVVVAHSQGGAIAHLALQAEAPANARTLVTFGSGLAKLEALLSSDRNAGERRSLWVVGPVIVGAVCGIIMLAGDSGNTRSIGLWVMGSAIFMAMIWVHVKIPAVMEEPKVMPASDALRWKLRRVRWVDVYASHDPVPNGRYPHAAAWEGVLESQAITNRRSVLTDHTSYWDNPVDFVSRVGKILDEECGAGLVTEDDQPAMAYAREVRAGRARWQFRLMLSGVLALLITLAFDADRLRAAGLTALEWMRVQPWPLTTAITVFGWLRDITGASVSAAGPILLALTVPLALLALWRAVMRRAWRAWDDWLLTLMHLRVVKATPDDTLYGTLFLIGAIAPPLVATLLVVTPAIRIGAVIAGALVVIMTLLAVVGLTRRDTDLRGRLLGAGLFIGFAVFVASYAAGLERVSNWLLAAIASPLPIMAAQQAYGRILRLGVRAGVSRPVARWLAALTIVIPMVAVVISVVVGVRMAPGVPWTGALTSASVVGFYAYLSVYYGTRWVLKRKAYRRRSKAPVDQKGSGSSRHPLG